MSNDIMESKKQKEAMREEAVSVLYSSLKDKHEITKEECYEIYDRMMLKKGEKPTTPKN